MSYSYTREEFLDKLKGIKPDSLYKSNEVNYKGKTKDTKEYYTEVFAEYLLNNLSLLQDLPIHPRTRKYRIPEHEDQEVPGDESNRHEEKIAIKLYRLYRDSEEKAPFGRILDYQVPLKENQKDDAGKIDLLSIKEGKILVLELKIPDSKETMLRCALESYTYYKTVDSVQLLKEYQQPEDSRFIPAPLTFIGKSQHEEYLSAEHPNLQSLMRLLGIQPIFISEELYKK